jgi:hypothetical protein
LAKEFHREATYAVRFAIIARQSAVCTSAAINDKSTAFSVFATIDFASVLINEANPTSLLQDLHGHSTSRWPWRNRARIRSAGAREMPLVLIYLTAILN